MSINNIFFGIFSIWLLAISMNFTQFINQANAFGKARTPFLFLIDFEQQKPLIIPLEQATDKGVNYDITFGNERLTNFDYSKKTPLDLKTFSFTASSISLNCYTQAFNLVQAELQRGNSYLLNLTFATPVATNVSFEQIFAHAHAKYKLWLRDNFVCFSPECFVEIANKQIVTYPMKGTIDASLSNAEQQLLDSDKETREHYTIVDLLRNDLSIVATNVKVTRFRYVERLSTHKGDILQTSSQITGNLSENWQENVGSILAKLLPAGSICGAPKQKTVEIIQNVEGQARGYYTGVFGIFLGNSLSSAVAIRYLEQDDNSLVFRSGGGITTLSAVQDEYQELLKKVYIPVNR